MSRSLSDVHVPCIYAYKADLVRIINAALPDIFVLAGNTIDKQANEGSVRMFKSVKARLGKLATLGNWEYLAGLDLSMLPKAYEESGISLLILRPTLMSQAWITRIVQYRAEKLPKSIVSRLNHLINTLKVYRNNLSMIVIAIFLS